MASLEDWIRESVKGRRVAVVGVGNRLRGDDGEGPSVAQRLGAPADVLVIDAGTVPENYIGVLIERAPDVVLFVDALEFDAAPGACCLAALDTLGARCSTTHAPSLALMSQILEPEGIECFLVGIQPRSTADGEWLTAEVDRGIDEAVRAISAAIGVEVCGV
jgi:hydrogenase 3 maturation protease